MMNEKLHTIMTTDVVTVSSTDTLAHVCETLFAKGFHHLPVVDDGKLMGIITSYDIIKCDSTKKEMEHSLIGDIMTKKVATLHQNDPIGAAAQVFLKHLFHGLPIVDDQSELVGIVTTHDILKFLFIKEYPNDKFIKDTNWIKK